MVRKIRQSTIMNTAQVSICLCDLFWNGDDLSIDKVERSRFCTKYNSVEGCNEDSCQWTHLRPALCLTIYNAPQHIGTPRLLQAWLDNQILDEFYFLHLHPNKLDSFTIEFATIETRTTTKEFLVKELCSNCTIMEHTPRQAESWHLKLEAESQLKLNDEKKQADEKQEQSSANSQALGPSRPAQINWVISCLFLFLLLCLEPHHNLAREHNNSDSSKKHTNSMNITNQSWEENDNVFVRYPEDVEKTLEEMLVGDKVVIT
ncbi:hypothetical protein RFI_10735 [Reticulomyxa filosa]|uniref:C3H1-type domain-containing protein n=1 Tax=Reticulomyxa filosa TaxID=46433 RepID=X6NJD8_RETFI|nr:hypothetical protein RFI_10735 [Reticulomyxa filosa]|eukprot:ETO26400.1 hypothetical protein RFI_10735 [Reticulomyxa filosa]